MSTKKSFSQTLSELLDDPLIGRPCFIHESNKIRIELTVWGFPEDHPAYATVSISNRKKRETSILCGTRVQIEALANANADKFGMLSTPETDESILESLENQLTPYENLHVAESPTQMRNPNTGDIGENKPDPAQSELDSIQSAAEKILTVDEGLIKAIQETFGDGAKQIDPKILAPKPVGYEFKDPTNPEKTIFRPLTSTIYNYVEGELLLVQSVQHLYDDITAPKAAGKMVITTFKAEVKKDAMIKIKRSFKMSKLGISFGFNFAGLLPAPVPDPSGFIPEKEKKQHEEDKKNLENANVIRQGDPAFSNGKKQDFTFGLDHIKVHAELMIKAYRKLEANFEPNPPVVIPF